MRAYFFLFIFTFFLIGCKKEPYQLTTDWQEISERVQFKESGNTFELKSGKFDYKISHNQLPFKRIVLLNASLVGYFTELGQENRIVGISSPEYVYSENVLKLIKDGKIANVGNEQKYDVEKIIALKPDVVFTNYITTFENTYDLLRKNGIQVIFLDDYMEQNPLEKSAYLLLFGKFFGMDKAAVLRFNEIQSSYDSLKNLTPKIEPKPIVLANEMYGNQWFLPGGKTSLAYFLKDAGANYINAENTEEKAVPMSFEEVFAKSQKAEFWVNVGNHHSKKELLQINPNYAKMHVFQKGKIYGVNGREKGKGNDFFESGVVRADLVLKDYIKIFHPELLPNYSLTYLKVLQ